MPLEHLNIVTPDFPEVLGDIQLSYPKINGPTPKIEISQLSEEESYESMNPLSPPTYEKYISEGSSLLREAISDKEKDGIRAAGSKYREAAAQFLGAIGLSPDDKKPNSIEGVDPILLLQYASCLTMQAEAGTVKPYKKSPWLDRAADLRLIASETLKKVDDSIMGPKVKQDENMVKEEIVISEGLWANHNVVDAKTVADKIEEYFDPHADTDSDVLNQLKETDAPVFLAAHELADQALLELTDTAELRIAA
jgi:hypothetical protein